MSVQLTISGGGSPSCTITIHDTTGTFCVEIDTGGYARLTLSVPTRRGAGYPQARREGMDEAVAEIRAHVADLRKRYPHAVVVGEELLDNADPETVARQHAAAARGRRGR